MGEGVSGCHAKEFLVTQFILLVERHASAVGMEDPPLLGAGCEEQLIDLAAQCGIEDRGEFR